MSRQREAGLDARGDSRQVALIASLAAAFPVFAAGPPGDEDASSWGLGIGVASEKKAYKDFDRDNKVVPLLQYENRYVRIMGPGIEVKLPGLRISDTQALHFGLVGEFDASGYKPKDSPVFTGMRERKSGFWVGARVEWETSAVNLVAEWKGDASGDSKGQMASLGLERNWHIGERWMLTPRLVAKWRDDKYVDYYYGVRSDEVRAGRPAYRGTSGSSAELGLRTMYLFDRHNAVFLDVGVSSLPASVKDSPLVDRSSEYSVCMGYSHRF